MGGGDKCLRDLAGRPLLAHVIDRVLPQASPLLLNANGDAARFKEFGLPVASDVVDGFAGPLAGVLTGMLWFKEHSPQTTWLLSIATDTPFFPTNMAERLHQAAKEKSHPLACAASNGRTHPVFGLWSLDLADDLRHALVVEDLRKIDAWTARHGIAEVEFSSDPVDPFFNANRSEDLAAAEAHYQTLSR